jgi:hypothetical protein
MAGFYISTLDATRFFERVLLTQSASRYGGKVEAVHDIRHADNAGKELPHRKAFNRDLTTLQDCWRNGNGQTERRGLHKAFHAVTFWANHLSSNRGGVVAVTQRNTRQMMPGGNRDKIINSAFNIAMQIAA